MITWSKLLNANTSIEPPSKPNKQRGILKMFGFNKKRQKKNVSENDADATLLKNLESNYRRKRASEGISINDAPSNIDSSTILSPDGVIKQESVIDMVDGSVEAFSSVLEALTGNVKTLARSVNRSLTKTYIDSGLVHERRALRRPNTKDSSKD